MKTAAMIFLLIRKFFFGGAEEAGLSSYSFEVEYIAGVGYAGDASEPGIVGPNLDGGVCDWLELSGKLLRVGVYRHSSSVCAPLALFRG